MGCLTDRGWRGYVNDPGIQQIRFVSRIFPHAHFPAVMQIRPTPRRPPGARGALRCALAERDGLPAAPGNTDTGMSSRNFGVATGLLFGSGDSSCCLLVWVFAGLFGLVFLIPIKPAVLVG